MICLVVNAYLKAPSGVTGPPQLQDSGTTVRAGSATSINVAYPAVATDDIAFINVVSVSIAARTIDTPSGWTAVGEQGMGNGSTTNRHGLYWKRLDGTETGNVTVSITGGTAVNLVGRMTTWRGCVASGTPFSNLQSFNPISPSFGLPVTTYSDPDLTLVNFFGKRNITFTEVVGGFTELYDVGNNISGPYGLGCTYKSLGQPTTIGETLLASSSEFAGGNWWSLYGLALIPRVALSSSTPLTGTDPFISVVKLLCGFEGTNGSTSFTDESPSARALTANGNAQISTAQSKFGSSSLLLDGMGDYLTATDSADWDLQGLPFTMEAWVRHAAGGDDAGYMGQYGATAAERGLMFYLLTTGTVLRLRYGNATLDVDSSWTPSGATWYHVVCERDLLGKTRTYVDGVMKGSTTTLAAAVTATGLFGIGRILGATTHDMNGHMDEVRVSIGVARYASDAGFTPPAAAFPRT